jgi:hypothetical protein
MTTKRILRRASLAIFAFVTLTTCKNTLMPGIRASVVAYTAKTIGLFGFQAAKNARLYVDVAGNVSGTNISVVVPKWVPLNNLVATYQFQGKSITVNGVAQTSGSTAIDFSNSQSSPIKYVVTPISGSPVSYSVTVTNGSQGLMGGMIQGIPLTLSGTVTTIAGKASPFGSPQGIVQVASTIYMADSRFNVIWAIDTNTHNYSVFAGSLSQPGYVNAAGTMAEFDTPQGIATDGTNVYVADQGNNAIRQITISGASVTTLAGSASGTSGISDGTGTSATFNNPVGLYYDPNSHLLFETDSASKLVRTVSTGGVVTTVVSSSKTTLSPYLSSPQELCIWSPPNYGDTGLTTGTPYYYEVSAISSNGESAHSVQQSITPYSASGTTPAAVCALAGNGKVTLSWTAVSGATSYNIYWSTTSGVNKTTYAGKITGVTSPSYAHSGRTNSTQYYYIITALVGGVESTTPSTQQSATPQATTTGAPTISTMTSGSAQATLAWNAIGGATSYNVYRSAIALSAGQVVDVPYLFVTDAGSNNAVYQFPLWTGYPAAPSSTVYITGGVSFDSGTAPAYVTPKGIIVYANYLFVADSGNNSIQKIDPATAGSGALYAGTGLSSGPGAGHVDGGNGLAMFFRSPSRLLMNSNTMFVSEAGNRDLREITSISTVNSTGARSSTLVGVWPDWVDGNGATARFSSPRNLASTGSALWLTDLGNDVARSIGLGSPYAVATIAGQVGSSTEKDGTGTGAAFSGIDCITTDGKNVYISDENGYVIRRLNIATGNVDTIAGGGSPGYNDAIGTLALFGDPRGITTDGANLYVVDNTYNSIRMINLSTMKVSTIAGAGASKTAGDTDNPTGTSATFNSPVEIATDGANLYVTCSGTQSIRQISLQPPYAVTTLAGPDHTVSGNFAGYVNATGTAARFSNPTGLATDGTYIYVADNGNNVIRRITLSGGAVTTLAGNATVVAPGEADVPPSVTAQFNSPNGIATDGSALYVTDESSHVIRMIR